jgi:CBS domain-containing protein
MAELDVGHMPVLEDGHLVGVLSERDTALVRSAMPGHFETVTVGAAMTAVPYCVSPEASVSEVARHMERRKLGSALVVDVQGKLQGLFTTTDALRLLSQLLEVA